MTSDTFFYLGLIITGLFCVAMYACDVYEARTRKAHGQTKPSKPGEIQLRPQSGDYPHSNVKEQ